MIFNQYAAKNFKTCNTLLVRDTGLFSLILSNKKMTTASTAIAVSYKYIKIIPFFVRSAKNIIYFLACCRVFTNEFMWHGMKKVEICCYKGMHMRGENK